MQDKGDIEIMIRKNTITILLSVLVLFLLAACATVDSSTHRGEKSYKTYKTESAEEKSDEQEVQNQEEEQKEHLYLRALTNVRLRKEPSTKGEYLATIQKGDCFEVFETKKADGYTWNRIFDNLWIADNGKWLEKIESLPETELNLTGFDNPTKIVDHYDTKTVTHRLEYIDDELQTVAYEDSSDGSVRVTDFAETDLILRSYGKYVTTIRDEEGRIIEQRVPEGHDSITVRTFSYNDKNQITAVGVCDSEYPGCGWIWYFDYYDDGKLCRRYDNMSSVTNEFLYNGNLVYAFLKDTDTGEASPLGLFRFDSKGRIIQYSWGGMLHDYYY